MRITQGGFLRVGIRHPVLTAELRALENVRLVTLLPCCAGTDLFWWPFLSATPVTSGPASHEKKKIRFP